MIFWTSVEVIIWWFQATPVFIRVFMFFRRHLVSPIWFKFSGKQRPSINFSIRERKIKKQKVSQFTLSNSIFGTHHAESQTLSTRPGVRSQTLSPAPPADFSRVLCRILIVLTVCQKLCSASWFQVMSILCSNENCWSRTYTEPWEYFCAKSASQPYGKSIVFANRESRQQ